MRVLLDEMLPAGVAELLPGHDVVTVQRAGLKGLTNGELLRRAAADGYAVLLTADRNLPAQQTSLRPESQSCSCAGAKWRRWRPSQKPS